MDQTSTGGFKKNESPFQAFYHSCLGKLVILGGILIILFIVAMMTKPTQEEMEMEMVDNILQCIEANDSIQGDDIDDQVNNLNSIFSRADTAKINRELLVSLKKNNRLEIYNHSFFRSAYIVNNIHPAGVRVGIGMFGIVYPTVIYKDLLLNVGPMQKNYKDGVIRTGTINTHDLGKNPDVKPYHYQGDPDQ
ncbi:MAG: hypothetical protein IKY01_02875 [Prevotella sp.]|nr:hypothetical protein [Prevotella sp.]